MNKRKFPGSTPGWLIGFVLFNAISAHAATIDQRLLSSTDLPTPANQSTVSPTSAEPAVATASTSNPIDSLSSEQINSHLFALEKQLFSEEYTTDTVNQRLDRLDRFVLGGVQNGSVSKRLNRLIMDIPTAQHAAPALARESAQPAAANAQANANQGTSSNNNEGSSETSSSGNTTSDTSRASGEDYPTVNALERSILGHTNENLPLPERLSKLEEKAFGKASPSSDELALRVDRLKTYERSKNGGDEYLSQSPSAFKTSMPVQTLSVTAKLDMMEKVVFAKNYAKDGVVSRLDRLEKTMFPSKPVETFASVPTRINRLMSTLQINQTGDADQIAQNGVSSPQTFADQNPGRAKKISHHPFLHRLGKIAGALGESALMSMSGGGMYGGYPGYGGMNGAGMEPGSPANGGFMF